MSEVITQIRDGRIVTQKDLTTDYTLNITNVDGGALRFSNNLRSINMVDDVGGALLRKVDFMDTMPSLDNATTVANMGYLGRTVVYTGDTNTTYQKGCAYKCVPVQDYTWTMITQNSGAQLLKFVDEIALNAFVNRSGASININHGDYLSLVNAEGNARCVIFYVAMDGEEELDINDRTIRMAVGCGTMEEAIATEATQVVLYTVSGDKLVRSSSINEYLSIFKGCTVQHVDDSIANLILGHINAINDPVPAFAWELITPDTDEVVSSYQTIYPIDNTCYLSNTPCCFFFGDLGTSGSVIITLDTSNLAVGQYYTNNTLYFEISDKTTITFASGEKSVNIIGDDISSIGKYKADVDVLPDGSISVEVTYLESATASGSTTYAYGFRFNSENNTNPNVKRITMKRELDANGDVAETIDVLNDGDSFSGGMPCHNLRRCVVKNGAVVYYLSSTDSRYRSDNRTYADLTGADGDVMVEIPMGYMRIVKRSDSSGELEYLFATTPIPDPIVGTYYQLIYNGVHPAFRVGGTVIGGSYEDDGETALRSPKSKIYIGAFESVRCHHGNMGITPHTLAVDASAYTDTTANSGSFASEDNYPVLESGIADGYLTEAPSEVNTEARSVAPYRSGDMVHVSIPGIWVQVVGGSSLVPAVAPGGFKRNLRLSSNIAGREYSYFLTTDTIYQSGKAYFILEGTVYKKIDVTPGDKVPSTDVYNRKYSLLITDSFTGTIEVMSGTSTVSATVSMTYSSANHRWELKVGTTIIFIANVPNDNFLTFDTLTWVPQTAAGEGTTCTVKDMDYKVYCGPLNYGTRNAGFAWADQDHWDEALAGNPNWALNYRPMTNVKRSVLHSTHNNAYLNRVLYYKSTRLEAVRRHSASSATPFGEISFANGKDEDVFVFDPGASNASYAIAYKLDSTALGAAKWYGLDSNSSADNNYRLFYDSTNGVWKYTDGTSSVIKDRKLGDNTAQTYPSVEGDYYDEYHRYLDSYDPGFSNPENIDTGASSGTTKFFEGASWFTESIPQGGNYTSQIYQLSEGDTTYYLGYSAEQMRWIISLATIANGSSIKIDDSVTKVVYRSNILGPDVCKWPTDGNIFLFDDQKAMHRRNFFGNTVSTQSVLPIGQISTEVTGDGSDTKYDFTYCGDYYVGVENNAHSQYYRHWKALINDKNYRLEYIQPVYTDKDGNIQGDTRQINGDEQKIVGDKYGGCWCIVNYGTTPPSDHYRTDAILAIEASDRDIVVQRLKIGDNIYTDAVFVPENIGSITSYTCALISNNATTHPTNVKLVFNTNSNKWELRLDGAVDALATTLNTVTSIGPWDPYLYFVVGDSAKVSAAENADRISSNAHVVKFTNTPLVTFKDKLVGRGANMNYRTAQYLTMLMLTEYGTFDIRSKLRGSKLPYITLTGDAGEETLNEATYARFVTFAGRTVSLGNRNGVITYDKDVDINIPAEAFYHTGDSEDKTVACSYRGIENPFGNIGEFYDGIIPAIRRINGLNVAGYYESIDPACYNDEMTLAAVAKYARSLRSASVQPPLYYQFDINSDYVWHSYTIRDVNNTDVTFNATGFMVRINSITLLPAVVNANTGAASAGMQSFFNYKPAYLYTVYKPNQTMGTVYQYPYVSVTGSGIYTYHSNMLDKVFSDTDKAYGVGGRLQI